MTNFTEYYRPLRPEPFDRNRTFIVRRKLTVQGKEFPCGSQLDTEYFTTRRLKQLYEQRFVTMADVEADGPLPDAKPVFEQMPTQFVRAWLEERYPYRGETWSAFRARVLEPLSAMPANGSGSAVAVVTSATPVSIWAGHALDLDDRNIWRLAGATYNSGVSRFDAKNDRLRMISFNETPHLDEPALLSVR